MIRLKGGQDAVAKRPKVKMTDPFACQLVAKHYENADELQDIMQNGLCSQEETKSIEDAADSDLILLNDSLDFSK